MPRTCTVCAHPKRTEIDQALLAGQPLRDIAGQFGTSRSALERHKKADIPKALAKAKEAAEDVRADSLFDRVKALSAEAKAILEDARRSKNHSIALQAIGRAEKLLELEGRLLGELNEAAKVAVGIHVATPGPWSTPGRLCARCQALSDLTDEELDALNRKVLADIEQVRQE